MARSNWVQKLFRVCLVKKKNYAGTSVFLFIFFLNDIFDKAPKFTLLCAAWLYRWNQQRNLSSDALVQMYVID